MEDGETAEIVGEFGSFRVLAVMRPPASELQPHGIVGNLQRGGWEFGPSTFVLRSPVDLSQAWALYA